MAAWATLGLDGDRTKLRRVGVGLEIIAIDRIGMLGLDPTILGSVR